ncbi:hypothetical protein ACFPLB_04055 [Aquamicrobium segne]|uniref:Uncharacterized protein n=1 Tax=Aquamicrobium segne TaxID=469547 RepID=A0ABW0GW71_9HYPH
MSEMPERIFAWMYTGGFNRGEWLGQKSDTADIEYVRADLYATLEAQLAEMVKIKPLEWSPVEEWKECSRERAPAFGGEYQIVMLDPGEGELPSLYFEIGLGAFMFRFEQDQDPMGLPGETYPKKFPSVNAAKAAAQADYERRILSAIAPHPRATNTVASHETANVSDKPEGQQPVAWLTNLGWIDSPRYTVSFEGDKTGCENFPVYTRPSEHAVTEAAGPFVTFANHAVEKTDGSWVWRTSSNERICDWFGPSDFGALKAAMEAGG